MDGGAARGDAAGRVSDSEDPDLKGVPAQLGRYQLRFKVASGGMAAVFIARAVGGGSFEKVVAVKTIHPHLEVEGSAVRMFMDEARIASAINHPNVCQVFDYGEQDGVHYLVMEFLFGEPLSRLTKRLAAHTDPALRARLPGLAARIVADAAEGLHAAHELKDAQGQLLEVVHRDVSPQNIFVTYDGGVKVVDFGVARARSRLEQTRAGEFKGKFEYVAPEQVAGKAFDRRADVWALGVTLWEALTLEKLFRREELAAVFSAIAFDPIPPPSSRAAWVPAGLDAIVAKALERDLGKRYQTARELGRALRQFLATSGEIVESAEVGELMEQLFSDDKAKRLKLKDAVLTGASLDHLAPVPVPAEMTVSQVSQSLSRPRAVAPPVQGQARPKPRAQPKPAPVPVPEPEAAEEDAEAKTPVNQEEVALAAVPAKSRAPLWAGLGVLVLLLGGGGAWLALRSPPVDSNVEAPLPEKPTVVAAVTPPKLLPVDVAPLQDEDAGAPAEGEDAGLAAETVPARDASMTAPDAVGGATPPVKEDAGAALPSAAVGEVKAPTALVDAGVVVPKAPDAGHPAVEPAPHLATPHPVPVPPRTPVKAPVVAPVTTPVVTTPVVPTTPRPAASETGYVRIKSGEVLEVLIDGRLVGKTPQNLELPVGTHRIELRVPGTEHGTVRMLRVEFAAEYTVELE